MKSAQIGESDGSSLATEQMGELDKAGKHSADLSFLVGDDGQGRGCTMMGLYEYSIILASMPLGEYGATIPDCHSSWRFGSSEQMNLRYRGACSQFGEFRKLSSNSEG